MSLQSAIGNVIADFCADVGFHFGFCRGEVKARRAIESIRVEQSHRGYLIVLAHSDQFLGKRGAFEEAECGTGVKLDIHQWSVLRCQWSVKPLWPLATDH